MINIHTYTNVDTSCSSVFRKYPCRGVRGTSSMRLAYLILLRSYAGGASTGKSKLLEFQLSAETP